MATRQDVASQLNQLFSKDDNIEHYITAQVVAVDGVTCTVEYDGIEITDVRLLPTTSVSADMILITPTIGSYVLVASDNGDLSNLWIVRIDTAEKVEIIRGDVSVIIDEKIEATCGASSLLIDKDIIAMNGGALGGLVVVDPLTLKLNLIEAQINALKAIFAAWTPVPLDGGLVLKTAITGWAGAPMLPTVKIEIENPKITQ